MVKECHPAFCFQIADGWRISDCIYRPKYKPANAIVNAILKPFKNDADRRDDIFL